MKPSDLCRKHGISETTLYKWKAKFGGMAVPETARLRTLEEENRRLKKLLAGDCQEFRVWAGGLNIVRPSLW